MGIKGKRKERGTYSDGEGGHTDTCLAVSRWKGGKREGIINIPTLQAGGRGGEMEKRRSNIRDDTPHTIISYTLVEQSSQYQENKEYIILPRPRLGAAFPTPGSETRYSLPPFLLPPTPFPPFPM